REISRFHVMALPTLWALEGAQIPSRTEMRNAERFIAFDNRPYQHYIRTDAPDRTDCLYIVGRLCLRASSEHSRSLQRPGLFLPDGPRHPVQHSRQLLAVRNETGCRSTRSHRIPSRLGCHASNSEARPEGSPQVRRARSLEE